MLLPSAGPTIYAHLLKKFFNFIESFGEKLKPQRHQGVKTVWKTIKLRAAV